jgi:hypothetical protein
MADRKSEREKEKVIEEEGMEKEIFKEKRRK